MAKVIQGRRRSLLPLFIILVPIAVVAHGYRYPAAKRGLNNRGAVF